jgi:hypothetical protein
MYLNYAINTLMQNIQTKISLEHYLVFPDINKYYFYDPTLQFEPRLYKRLSYFNYEDREDPFICAMWSRGVLDTLSEQARKFQGTLVNTNVGTGDLFNVKNVKCQLNLCFVSNDPEYITSFEESFILNYDRSISIQTSYSIPVTHRELGNIINLNQSVKTFTFQGQVDFLIVEDTVTVINSSSNNNNYTVTAITLDNLGNTVVSVLETIPSSIIDGQLTKYNATVDVPVTLYFSDIKLDQLDKLETGQRGELVFLLASMYIQYPVVQNVTLENGGNGNGSDKIIEHIYLRTKTVSNASIQVASDMVLPYDETIIE